VGCLCVERILYFDSAVRTYAAERRVFKSELLAVTQTTFVLPLSGLMPGPQASAAFNRNSSGTGATAIITVTRKAVLE
jgi:hypothetical protein